MNLTRFWATILCIGSMLYAEQEHKTQQIPLTMIASAMSQLYIDANYDFLKNYLQQDLSGEQRTTAKNMLTQYAIVLKDMRNSNARAYYPYYILSVPVFVVSMALLQSSKWSKRIFGSYADSFPVFMAQLSPGIVLSMVAVHGLKLDEQYTFLHGDVQIKRTEELLAIFNKQDDQS